MNTRQTRVFPGQFSSLAEISEFIVKAAQAAGLDKRATYAVQMAVDEACSNIIEHAYKGGQSGQIECTYEISPETLTITLCDQGQPFDPTYASAPDLSAKLKDRASGGLGIYFIRKLMDSVEYCFADGCGNVLKLVKRRETSA
jgi:anti-sigma regulatory factor (Ser/Thr protein kinase)